MKVQFTFEELLMIDHAFGWHRGMPDGMLEEYEDMLIVVGDAINRIIEGAEANGKPKELELVKILQCSGADLDIEEDMLWSIRHAVPVMEKNHWGTPVGLGIHRKIYAALANNLQCEQSTNDFTIEDLLGKKQSYVKEHAEQTAISAKILMIEEGEVANASTSPGEDPSSVSNEGTGTCPQA